MALNAACLTVSIVFCGGRAKSVPMVIIAVVKDRTCSPLSVMLKGSLWIRVNLGRAASKRFCNSDVS
eukprot:3247766-Pyramimonas_sp.AAC.1